MWRLVAVSSVAVLLTLLLGHRRLPLRFPNSLESRVPTAAIHGAVIRLELLFESFADDTGDEDAALRRLLLAAPAPFDDEEESSSPRPLMTDGTVGVVTGAMQDSASETSGEGSQPHEDQQRDEAMPVFSNTTKTSDGLRPRHRSCALPEFGRQKEATKGDDLIYSAMDFHWRRSG